MAHYIVVAPDEFFLDESAHLDEIIVAVGDRTFEIGGGQNIVVFGVVGFGIVCRRVDLHRPLAPV
jgi:hypothetical protein